MKNVPCKFWVGFGSYSELLQHTQALTTNYEQEKQSKIIIAREGGEDKNVKVFSVSVEN